MVAIASAAGIELNWDDFDELSAVVPTLANVYPNSTADINHFAAGGIQTLIGQPLDAGLLHTNVPTVAGHGLDYYRAQPFLEDDELVWRATPSTSQDQQVFRDVAEPFAQDGGLRVLSGNLGCAVTKISAVQPEHRTVTAPTRVFDDQRSFTAAFVHGSVPGRRAHR